MDEQQGQKLWPHVVTLRRFDLERPWGSWVELWCVDAEDGADAVLRLRGWITGVATIEDVERCVPESGQPSNPENPPDRELCDRDAVPLIAAENLHGPAAGE